MRQRRDSERHTHGNSIYDRKDIYNWNKDRLWNKQCWNK